MSQRFATTQWTVVLAARDGSDSQARQALEALCDAYWFPLYAYVRRRGQDPDAARDLTQAFFADLLGRDFLESIDASRGRFRSFLLASLENFLGHERDRAQALKKGGGTRILSLDAEEAETRYRQEPAERLTPDVVFERRWGLTVMERAMRRLEAAHADDRTRFAQLKPCLTGEQSGQYRELAGALGLSEGAVKTAVHRLRHQYGRALRDEIAETVASEAEVDAELRHLLEVIRPWQA